MRFGAFVRFGAGLVAWSVAEYATHRLPMHARRGSSPLADEHLDHHADPGNARPLRVDPHNVGFKGVGFVVAARLGTPLFACGFTVGYAGYTHLHHQIHHRAPRARWQRALWRHHHAHHFSGPARNFGVTSTLWDHVLGTFGRVDGPISIPVSRAPTWLQQGRREGGYLVVSSDNERSG